MQSKSFKSSLSILVNCSIVLLLVSSFVVDAAQRRKVGGSAKKRLPIKVTNDVISEWNSKRVCETELCAQLSSRLRTMGKLEEVDPCDDFYKFACGGYGGSSKKWAQEVVLSRLDDIFHEAFDTNEPTNFGGMSRMVQRERPVNATSSMKRLSSLFSSCIRRETGYEPLLRILRKLGGFPLLPRLTNWTNEGETVKDTRNWFDLLLQMSPQGLDHNHFFSLTIGIDPTNTSSIMLKLGSLYLRDPDIEFVDNYLTTLTAMDPNGLDRDKSVHQLVNVKRFHQALFNISKEGSSEGCKRQSIQRMTFRQLRELAPKTDWLRFVQYIFETNSIELDDTILVTDELFVSKVDDLLWRTDIKTLVNYIFLNIISDLKPELLLPISGPAAAEFSLKEDCRSRVAKELPFDLSSEYVRRFMEPQVRNRVYSLARYVQRELRHALEGKIDWLVNEQTKARARDKLDNMLLQVGYTSELVNETRLDKMFNGIVEFQPEDYIGNLLKLTSARRLHEASYLHKPYRSLAWESFSRTYQVNAVYQPGQNAISIFAGQLTEAHYQADRPQYMNFGQVGSTVGHELGHAFDADSARRDQCGQMPTTEPWWDKETARQYATRVACIRSAYDGLEMPNTTHPFRLNGNQTLNENIADFTGYKLAYLAYNRWLLDNERVEELRLPKLEQFSGRQLFWLALASKRCDFESPDKQARKFRGNSHSPEMFRVNVPLQNMKEFSQDYQCSPGSRMNPGDKCEIW